MTVANLGFAVDSSQAAGAATDLDKLAASAARAEAAAASLGSSGVHVGAIGTQANAAAGGIKNASFQTANFAAQLNDIAVTLASGQSPFTVALQQGSQINQIIGEQGAKGAVMALGAAFTSLVNPVSLATIGIIAFGGFAIQAIGSLIPKTESATEALKRHRDEILLIVQGYAGATKAANDYLAEAGRAPQGVVQSNLEAQAKDLRKEADAFNQRVSGYLLSASPNVGGTYGQVRDLLQTFKDSKGDAGQLATELTKIKNTDLGFLGFGLKKVIEDLADGATKASSLQQSLMSLSFIQVAASSRGDVKYALDQKIAGDQSAASYKLQLQSITALGPAQQAQIAYQQKLNELSTSDLTHVRQIQEAEQARSLAYTQSAFAISEADRARLRSANDNVAASRVSIEVIGKSISETTRLQFVQQQLSAAQADAARNGVTVSAAYIAEIKKIAAAYGELQQKIAETQLLSDLQFQRDQLGRTTSEQNVASQLRPFYGDDTSSAAAQNTAAIIRMNSALADLKATGEDVTKGFIRDFTNDLKNGTSVIGSFADAALNAFDKISNKLIDMAVNNLFSNAFGGATSGGSGNWLSGLLGVFGLGGGSSGGTPGNFSIGGMPSYAGGTNDHPGGWARINDGGGPEIVNLPKGSQVIPAGLSRQAGGTAMSFTFAPVYGDIQGGTSQDIADLKQQMAQDRVSFEARVQRAVRDPRNRAA